MLKFKKILDNVIKKVDLGKDDAFFFCTNLALGYDGFYFAKELSKKGNCYYKFTDKLFKIYEPPKNKPIFFRGIIIKFIFKLVFDLDIIFYETNKVPRPGVAFSFIKENDIKEYAPKISFTDICFEVIKKSKSKSKRVDNLIIDQGPIENIIKFDTLIDFYKKLFELPLEFAFKKHPDAVRVPSTKEDLIYYELFKNCKNLPTYMPVQLFGNNIKKNVVGVFSASLITLSQLQHLNTISILELVGWHHESFKKEWKEYLISASNNKIIFPESFNELKEILLSK
jgi:hypothetical protein